MIVGNPIRLRFPPTKSGKRVVFFDLEDESGLANVTCFDDTYIKYGQAIVCSQYVTILGEAQDRDGHIAFLAQSFSISAVSKKRSANRDELADQNRRLFGWVGFEIRFRYA